MGKTQIIVTQTLTQFGQQVADANYQPTPHGPVSYQVVTAMANGTIISTSSGSFPNDTALIALAVGRGATTWDESDIITALGI